MKTLKLIRHPALRGAFLLAALLPATTVDALECGDFTFPKCAGPDAQYAGGFDPKTGYGGFGGGDCTATRTPVVFIHGNGDRAVNWDSPIDGAVQGYPPPPLSVYDELKAQGYNDCELFGVTYLTADEQANAEDNFHRPKKYQIIKDFIEAVTTYTGKDQVDLVTHSLGVSMSLAALKYHDAWGSVRRLVNIAGGIRGLNSCLYVGPANPLVPTCGSENIFDRFVFGFYPYFNRWTGTGTDYSLRQAPARHPEVAFYTLHAGSHDEIHCATLRGFRDCAEGALFEAGPNVRAQLDVGAGSTASRVDFDFSDWSPWNLLGGDTDGVGHFKARNNTGEIIYTMLTTDCKGLSCKGSYRSGPVEARSP